MKLTVIDQIKKAMDGRTQRWLSFEAKIAESELSKKMKGHELFKDEEIERINAVLGSSIQNKTIKSTIK